MQPYNHIPEGSGARSFMDAIETKIQNNRVRIYRRSAKRHMKARSLQLRRLHPIDTRTAERVREATYILIIQVSRYLDDDLLHHIAYYVINLDYLVLARTAGRRPETLGFYKQIGGKDIHITIALNSFGRDLSEFELAAILFHELVHAADPENNKLNVKQYRNDYIRSVRAGKMAPFIAYGSKDIKELVPRAFEGALFGQPRFVRDSTEFEDNVFHWRTTYPNMVRFVHRDCYRLFAVQQRQEDEV